MSFTPGRWLRAGWIDSHEGFSVKLGRDTLIYQEGRRRMAITVDSGGEAVVIFSKGLGRWNDDMEHSVGAEEKSRIEGNAKRALESQGYIVELDRLH